MMNSALLLDRAHALVIDPGVLPSELDELAAAAAAARAEKVTLFLTHPHWDHVLGRPWWPDAEVIAHDGFAATVQHEQARTLAEAGRIATEHGESWTRGFRPFRPREAVSGLRYTTRGPWHLVFRDAPGHCDSQLTLHLPDRRILFAADMLSDVEIPMLDRPPAVYRRTLETLRVVAEGGGIETVVPGHGTIARGGDAVLARLREDLAYLEELERRATACARARKPLDATQSELDAMEYRGKNGGPFPMVDVHRENVRLAHAAAAAGDAPPRPAKKR
jgi:glyoxylase-like metal-dependent hydrolase (beta-lactamase superfamily II)